MMGCALLGARTAGRARDRLPTVWPAGGGAAAGLGLARHPWGGGRGGRRPEGDGPRRRGAGESGIAFRGRGGAGGPEGLRRLERGPSAAPHRAARPRARCGRRAIHTPSGHSARRGGGGRRFNGDFAGRRRGRGRGPAAGDARCYAVAAGPAARARRPHYAGNAV